MKFKKLRELGFKVLCFESYRGLPKASAGMPDYLIIGKRKKGDIYFVERKYKGDKFRNAQKEIAEYLKVSANYFVLTEDNEAEIIEKVLKRLDK